jgi:hypothetical protein
MHQAMTQQVGSNGLMRPFTEEDPVHWNDYVDGEVIVYGTRTTSSEGALIWNIFYSDGGGPRNDGGSTTN